MKGYDYSKDNLYFVTICVQDRVCCFGEVVESRDLLEAKIPSGLKNSMQLNRSGDIAKKRLEWLEQQYQYVVLHAFIVMPNHVHAIIEIDRLRVTGEPVKIKSLSELVGAFKTTSSKLIHIAGLKSFKWQRSFHDHIIKTDRAFKNISNYIETNAERWHKDTFNTWASV